MGKQEHNLDSSFSLKEMIVDLREEQRELIEKAIRVEGIVEEILGEARRTNGRVTKHDQQIKKLERDTDMFSAKLATYISIFTLFFSFMVNYLIKKFL